MIFIKRVITALLNENVNKELKKDLEIDVLSDDFLYQEAVIEFIEKNEKIDFLLLNEELPGETIKEFINKIKNIKIILFVENSKKEDLLSENQVYRIYKNGEISIDEIKQIIKQENYTQKLEEEIEILKKIIQEKSDDKNKKITFKKEKSQENKKGKIISIIGTNEISKLLYIKNKSKLTRNKSLFISFNWLNEKQEKEILDKKIEIADIKAMFFRSNNNIENIEKYINEKKKEYDYIFINHSTECFYDLNMRIIQKAEKIYFIIEKNIEEINFGNKLLKIITEYWNLNKEKIEIIINKVEKNIVTKKYKNKRIQKIPYQTKVKENVWI